MIRGTLPVTYQSRRCCVHTLGARKGRGPAAHKTFVYFNQETEPSRIREATMPRKWIEIAVVSIVMMALGGMTASAQFTVAGSFYESFNGGTKTGNGTVQTSPNSAGGMMELRNIQKNPLIGYELSYSYNPANQTYATQPAPNCGYECYLGTTPETVKAYADQAGISWVPSMKVGNLRPFGVAGVGAFVDTNSVSLGNLGTVVRPMWIYGAGVDWGFLKKGGLRLQYRGELYKDPNLDHRYTTTGAFVDAAMPMVGFYFTL